MGRLSLAESRHIYFGWSSGHISKNWAEAERQVRASCLEAFSREMKTGRSIFLKGL